MRINRNLLLLCSLIIVIPCSSRGDVHINHTATVYCVDYVNYSGLNWIDNRNTLNITINLSKSTGNKASIINSLARYGLKTNYFPVCIFSNNNYNETLYSEYSLLHSTLCNHLYLAGINYSQLAPRSLSVNYEQSLPMYIDTSVDVQSNSIDIHSPGYHYGTMNITIDNGTCSHPVIVP